MGREELRSCTGGAAIPACPGGSIPHETKRNQLPRAVKRHAHDDSSPAYVSSHCRGEKRGDRGSNWRISHPTEVLVPDRSILDEMETKINSIIVVIRRQMHGLGFAGANHEPGEINSSTLTHAQQLFLRCFRFSDMFASAAGGCFFRV